jgi:putative peptide zinc metalloprotease protein
LVAVLATNLELVQQLLPTLRFDGYYIVADLVGVPDLFRYIGPILRRALLRRPADARLTLLKRWPQRVIAGWVLLVGPVLGAQLAYLFFEAPRLVRSDERSISALVSQAEYGGNALLSWLSAFVQIALLVLPLAGLLLLAVQLARGLARAGLRRTRARAGG